jgi:hypothetical protein
MNENTIGAQRKWNINISDDTMLLEIMKDRLT